MTSGQPIIVRPAVARRATTRRASLRRVAARRSIVVSSTALATALALGGAVAPAQAAPAAFDPLSCVPDFSPPTITAFSFSPKSVNVKKKAKTVSVTAKATDAQGVASMTVIFASPKKGKKQSFAAANLKRTAGTARSGTFTGKAKVERWVIPGAWKVNAVMASDVKGAPAFLDHAALTAKKWDRDLKVRSKPDLKAPKLTSFALSPTKVDTRSRTATVRITAKATDKQSGVAVVGVTLTKTGDKESVQTVLRRSKGSANKGTFTGRITIPRWVGNARWNADAQVMDTVGNNRAYSNAALKKRKWKRSVAVQSGVDTVAPTLTALSSSPSALSSSNGPVTVSATATLKDGESGVRSAKITWTGPSGYSTFSVDLARVSGTPASGTWKGTGTTPCFAEPGVWKASAVVTDVAGNTRTYTSAQLAAAGFTTDITVTMTL